MNKKILIVSLIINLIIIFFFSSVIYHPPIRIKANRIIKNVHRTLFYKDKKEKVKMRPNYFTQKSHYESLPDTKNEIIFLGDSITDYCRWSEMFQNLNIKNRGIVGDMTGGVVKRLNEVVSSSPDKIFIMIGVNDLSSRRLEISEIEDNYEKIIKFIIKKTPLTIIYVQSLLPVNEDIPNRLGHATTQQVIKVNKAIRQLCVKYQLQYIDLFANFRNNNNQLKKEYTSDGLHPNGKGYSLWMEAIEDFVKN